MFINTVSNSPRVFFRAQEGADANGKITEASVQKEAPVTENKEETYLKSSSDNLLKPQAGADNFQREGVFENLQIPTVAQINKMQTTQKLLGGTIASVGLLGIGSAFSSKAWVRALFAVPVGGLITLLGVNMFRMASSLDKLKDIVANNPVSSK